VFSPNGDGAADAVTLNYVVLAPLALEFKVFDTDNHLIRTIRQDHTSIGAASITWDGRNDAGGFVGSGVYRVNVREHDLYVTADNTPPDVAVSIGSGLHIVTPTNCVAVGAANPFAICQPGSTPSIARPYWVLSGHVHDENLVSRRLEAGAGVNPSEWVLLEEGATRQGALAPDGTIKLPVEDVDLRTLTTVADVYRMRIRLTATDRAGNRTTRVSDFAPEEIIAFAWDAAPIPVNSAIEQKPGRHTISVQHTLRRPVDALALQYRLENGVGWSDGPSVPAAANGLDLSWDTSMLVPGRTYEVRVVGIDGVAVVHASNLFSIHSNRFELTRIDAGTVVGLESLREPLADIRLVLAESGDLDMGSGPAQRMEPPNFAATVNGSRVNELCRTGRPALPVRFKGVAQSGAVYYTNTKSIPCRHEPIPEGGVLQLNVARVFADACGQPNPEQIAIVAGVADFGGLVPGSETLSIQEVPNGLLKPLEG
jgi:hypothetical protein